MSSARRVKLKITQYIGSKKEPKEYDLKGRKIYFRRGVEENKYHALDGEEGQSYVLLPKSKLVSSDHGILERDFQVWKYKDTSTNGTFIGSKHLRNDKQDVEEGTVITIPTNNQYDRKEDRVEIELKALPRLLIPTNDRKICQAFYKEAEKLEEQIKNKEEAIENKFFQARAAVEGKLEIESNNPEKMKDLFVRFLETGVQEAEKASDIQIFLGEPLGTIAASLEFGIVANENAEFSTLIDDKRFYEQVFALVNRLEKAVDRIGKNKEEQMLIKKALRRVFREVGESYKHSDMHNDPRAKVLLAFNHIIGQNIIPSISFSLGGGPRPFKHALKQINHDLRKEYDQLFESLDRGFKSGWDEYFSDTFERRVKKDHTFFETRAQNVLAKIRKKISKSERI